MITDSDRKLVERVWRAVFGHSPIVIDLDDVYGAGFGISIAGFDVCPKAAPDPFDIGRMISDGCITSNHLVMTLDGPVPASEVEPKRIVVAPYPHGVMFEVSVTVTPDADYAVIATVDSFENALRAVVAAHVAVLVDNAIEAEGIAASLSEGS